MLTKIYIIFFTYLFYLLNSSISSKCFISSIKLSIRLVSLNNFVNFSLSKSSIWIFSVSIFFFNLSNTSPLSK